MDWRDFRFKRELQSVSLLFDGANEHKYKKNDVIMMSFRKFCVEMFYSGSIYHVRLCAGLSRLSALLFHGKLSIMTSQQWQIRIWNDRRIARIWEI